MMGGTIDWTALPTICELIGIEDVETLVMQLLVIRNHKKDS